MIDFARLLIEAAIAVLTMATLGVLAGFAFAAVSGDTALSLTAGLAVFVLTGVIHLARVWWLGRGLP